MEQITQGKLKILKGQNFVTIYKNGSSGSGISSWNEDLWSFVDGLVGKGYEVMSVNIQGVDIFVTLKK